MLGKIQKLFALFTFLFSFYLCAGKTVLFVMGPCCSGKTTITEKLFDKLGSNWALINFDKIYEKRAKPYDKDEALVFLLEDISECLSQGKSVIVDTNRYQQDLEKCLLEKAKVLKVLLYAPLKALNERDEFRPKWLDYWVFNLKRRGGRGVKVCGEEINDARDQSKRRTRTYIIDYFVNFYDLKPHFGISESIDMINKKDINFCCTKCLINRLEESKIKFYKTLFSSDQEFELFPRFSFDLLLKTEELSIKQCLDRICELLTTKGVQNVCW